ncbi:MAG: outer membrane protein OmpA-like peptidoglycan-associated protein [Myxococcota bacterium]|jgi:outer membrane protein OmpA-like peptidoglycan-associated protein
MCGGFMTALLLFFCSELAWAERPSKVSDEWDVLGSFSTGGALFYANNAPSLGYSAVAGMRGTDQSETVFLSIGRQANPLLDSDATIGSINANFGVWFYALPKRTTSPYLGAMLGVGSTNYYTPSDATTENNGYGIDATAVGGIEMNRSSRNRLFLQSDLIFPFYQTIGPNKTRVPRLTLSIGVTFDPIFASSSSESSGSSRSSGSSGSSGSSDTSSTPSRTPSVIPSVVAGSPRATLNRDRCTIDINTPILFGEDKDEYLPESEPIVRSVAEAIMATDDIRRVMVQGHTDTRGEVVYNFDLSKRRVQSVVDGLVEMGVPSSQLRIRGFGESSPLYPDATTEEKHAANRRVEFIVVWADGPCDNTR